MRLHVYEREDKITVKVLKPFFTQRRLIRQCKKTCSANGRDIKAIQQSLDKKKMLLSKKELQIVVLNCYKKVFLMDKRLRQIKAKGISLWTFHLLKSTCSKQQTTSSNSLAIQFLSLLSAFFFKSYCR